MRRSGARFLTAIPSSGSSPNQMVPGGLTSLPSGLVVLLLNARSVQNKISLIHDLIVDEGADLVCIIETWVGELGGVTLTHLCLPGNRLEGQGGGFAMVYRNTISLSRLPVHLSAGLECLYFVLGTQDILGILLVYHSPHCPTVSLPELTEVVSTWC